jgi:hypothetical protein
VLSSLEQSALKTFSGPSGSENHVETKALELDPKGFSYHFHRAGSDCLNSFPRMSISEITSLTEAIAP